MRSPNQPNAAHHTVIASRRAPGRTEEADPGHGSEHGQAGRGRAPVAEQASGGRASMDTPPWAPCPTSMASESQPHDPPNAPVACRLQGTSVAWEAAAVKRSALAASESAVQHGAPVARVDAARLPPPSATLPGTATAAPATLELGEREPEVEGEVPGVERSSSGVQGWSAEQVVEWLQANSLGGAELAAAVLARGVDGSVLLRWGRLSRRALHQALKADLGQAARAVLLRQLLARALAALIAPPISEGQLSL